MTAIVQECVNRFLEHAFLIAHDDLGRAQVDQLLQTVVAIDNTTVKIVQVGGGETPALKRDQGAQIRRNDRQDIEHHPLGQISRDLEVFDDLEGLGDLLEIGAGRIRLLQGLAQVLGKLVHVKFAQQVPDRLGADLGLEIPPEFGDRVLIFLLGQKVVLLERCRAGVQDHVLFVINDLLKVPEADLQQCRQSARDCFIEPDMRNRTSQVNMPHALATHGRARHQDAAAVARDPLELDPFIFAAIALPVADRPEDAFAKKAVLLRLERAVVERLRLPDRAAGP